MLTVKHIANDGTETIMEAEMVERVSTGDRFNDGLYLDRQSEMEANTINPGRGFKHCFAASSAELGTGAPGPIAYVMNRFGSTVATYHL